jgi:FKBP-type peptidyl-prolyl cis-trans isomerase
MPRQTRSLIPALCGFTLLLATVPSVAQDPVPAEPPAEAPATADAGEDVPEVVTTDSGLQYADLEVGMGPAVRKGDLVEVHYLGWLPDGTVFDSSRARNQTFRFQVGRRQVVKGWDEGVVGMQVGGKRRLLLPPELGYGKRGAGEKIPPDASLFFEIELVGIR